MLKLKFVKRTKNFVLKQHWFYWELIKNKNAYLDKKICEWLQWFIQDNIKFVRLKYMQLYQGSEIRQSEISRIMHTGNSYISLIWWWWKKCSVIFKAVQNGTKTM